jgi:3-methyladenine DNA glycosylase AlkC
MSIRRTEPLFSLADQLFNKKTVAILSNSLASVHEEFDRKKFEREVIRRFPVLALKQRISCLVDVLEEHLPTDFDSAIAILAAALPEPLDPKKLDDDFGEFIWAVPGEYVARHGCTQDRLQKSLGFLRKATMRFTSESTIRPFLNAYPKQTLEFVHRCAVHENYHIRRLASEGIRPYLPWAKKVIVPVQDVISVLTRLHADKTRYVTRSVANTLNDLTRVEPDQVINTLKSWRNAGAQSTKELDWMTRHALRTLTKAGHADALELLGYPSQPKFTVTSTSAEESVKVGESLRWQGQLESKENQKLKISLRVYFLRADGSHSIKVFAVKDLTIKKDERLAIDKKLSFKPISTRTLYPGLHHVELDVNGVARGKRSFQLVV